MFSTSDLSFHDTTDTHTQGFKRDVLENGDRRMMRINVKKARHFMSI